MSCLHLHTLYAILGYIMVKVFAWHDLCRDQTTQIQPDFDTILSDKCPADASKYESFEV